MHKTAGATFLDVFAGSGAVGIEALSRGAVSAVFLEMNRLAVKTIHENLANCHLAEEAEVYSVEAVQGLKILAKKGRKFDIIFLGAPYDSPDLIKALEFLGQPGLFLASGLVVAEHRRRHLLESAYGSLKTFREERYGETVFTFYENSNLSG